MQLINLETGHWAAVHAVVTSAFGRTDEADLVERLRVAGDVALELAAIEDGAIVGHILFSELIVEPADRRIAALAPLSVAPDWQNRGVGSELAREGLARCAKLEFDGSAVLGDTEYYSRFGFQLETAKTLNSIFSGSHFQALEFRPGVLSGGSWRLTYPKAFD